jgi:uncharacterized SAM-binding protein YcdF (DUF218 family)
MVSIAMRHLQFAARVWVAFDTPRLAACIVPTAARAPMSTERQARSRNSGFRCGHIARGRSSLQRRIRHLEFSHGNVNDLFVLLGIQSWKPILTAVALPPVPWLLLMLVGARMMFWRRTLSWLVMLLGAAGVWLSCTTGVGYWLERTALKPPPALEPDRIAEIKRIAGVAGNKVAIVVLGGGREAMAPEYGLANLNHRSLQRLHYGVWLARQTGAPILFSGGVGHADSVGVSEAEAAARIAERDYGKPLTWTESESRDTRENAVRSVAMLKPAGITDLILVTHAYHMPRAMRAFQLEVQRSGSPIRIWPAPMGLAQPSERSVLSWLPTMSGFERVHLVLHELSGLLFGA